MKIISLVLKDYELQTEAERIESLSGVSFPSTECLSITLLQYSRLLHHVTVNSCYVAERIRTSSSSVLS